MAYGVRRCVGRFLPAVEDGVRSIGDAPLVDSSESKKLCWKMKRPAEAMGDSVSVAEPEDGDEELTLDDGALQLSSSKGNKCFVATSES